MKSTTISITALLVSNTLLWGNAPLFSNAHANKAEDITPLPDRVDMSIKPGNVRNISEINLFSPIRQSKNHVKFLSLMAKGDTKDSNEINLGYGERTINNDDHIIGYYGYFDARKTKYNNVYTQITVGAEYLSDPVDVRVNGYLPIDKYHHIPREVNVVQANGTLNIAHANREYALGGWDLEVGTQYKFNKYNSFHVYAGHFDFRNKNTRTISGNRYRTEMRFDNLGKHFPENSRFTWGYETQKDKVRGKVRYNMLRLSIPLYTPQERPDLITGLRRRLIDPVIRDVDIVATTNVKNEQAFFTDKNGNITNKKATGVKRVSTGADLYRATTLGKEGDIIVMTKDITTTLEMTMQKNQHLSSGGSKIGLTTASGIKINYQPTTGTKKTFKNTLPGSIPLKLADGAKVSNIGVKRTVYNTDNTDANKKKYKTADTRVEDVNLFIAEETNAILKANDSNSYYQTKTVQLDNKNYTYKLKCMNPSFDEKIAISPSNQQMMDCDTSKIAIDSQGRVRLKDNTIKHMPLKIQVLDGSNVVAVNQMAIFSKTGVAEKKAKFDEILPNTEIYRGIILRYGNDFKCSKDEYLYDDTTKTCKKGSSTDTGTVKKIDEVKRIIDGLLNKRYGNSKHIEERLRKSGAMMTLYNNEGDRDDEGQYRDFLKNNQDLQATETFVNGQGNKGLSTSDFSGAGKKRSAALEEIAHLIHNYGFTRYNPEWQERLDAATQEALEKTGEPMKWHRKDELPRRDLDDEYLADGLESYFNMRGGQGVTKSTSICGANVPAGTDCTTVGKTSREMLKNNHRKLYDLIEEMIGVRSDGKLY